MDIVAEFTCDCGCEIPITTEMLESENPVICPKCGTEITIDVSALNADIDDAFNKFTKGLDKNLNF